jgi:hypothetical protein
MEDFFLACQPGSQAPCTGTSWKRAAGGWREEVIAVAAVINAPITNRNPPAAVLRQDPPWARSYRQWWRLPRGFGQPRDVVSISESRGFAGGGGRRRLAAAQVFFFAGHGAHDSFREFGRRFDGAAGEWICHSYVPMT